MKDWERVEASVIGGIYHGDWKSYEDVLTEFSGGHWDYQTKSHIGRVIPDGFPLEEEIEYASYDTPSYEGYATIIFNRDGVLYEYSDSHCSCNGLEWSTPTKTTQSRLDKLREEKE